MSDLVTCKACKKELLTSAPLCPYCNASNPTKQPLSLTKKLLIGFALLTCFLAFSSSFTEGMVLLKGYAIIYFIYWCFSRAIKLKNEQGGWFKKKDSSSPSNKKAEPKKTIQRQPPETFVFTTMARGAPLETSPNNSVTQEEKEWVPANTNIDVTINRGDPLEISLTNITHSAANDFEGMLKADLDGGSKRYDLALFLLQNNSECPEVNSYISSLKNITEPEISKLQSASKKWQVADDEDKEWILEEFQEEALEKTGMSCILDMGIETLLFTEKPKPLTADFLNSFTQGYLLETYVFLLRDKGKIVSVDPKSRQYKVYKELVSLGLASFGDGIKTEDVLNALKMRDINLILKSEIQKTFRKKIEAVNAAMELPNIKELLIEFCPLDKMLQINIPAGVYSEQIYNNYYYARETVKLIQSTYNNCKNSLNTLQEAREDPDTFEFAIDSDFCCYACEKHEKTTKRPPKKIPPFHIGCSCHFHCY